MPVLLEAQGGSESGAGIDAQARARCVTIGLLNNMSDAGLLGGERQFIGLLEAAAGDLVVRLKLYSLPAIPRGSAMRARLDALYGDLPHLLEGRLDGLIVTGAEPVAPRLPDEGYWRDLASVIDWAEHHTTSTLWSCLSAHAAVLHLDGVERQPIGEKRSGIYTFKRRDDHPLLAGLGVLPPLRVPHSRFNGLGADDLARHGYSILTQSETVGIDLFVKQWRSLFVYLQGHPEYDTGALAREYRRDVQRYLARESDYFPGIPENYLLKPMEERLRTFEILARIERTPETMALFPLDRVRRPKDSPADTAAPVIPGLRTDRWKGDAIMLMRNWLHYLASHRS